MMSKYSNKERKGLPGGPNEQFSYVTGFFMQSNPFRSMIQYQDGSEVNPPYNYIDRDFGKRFGKDSSVLGYDNNTGVFIGERLPEAQIVAPTSLLGQIKSDYAKLHPLPEGVKWGANTLEGDPRLAQEWLSNRNAYIYERMRYIPQQDLSTTLIDKNAVEDYMNKAYEREIEMLSTPEGLYRLALSIKDEGPWFRDKDSKIKERPPINDRQGIVTFSDPAEESYYLEKAKKRLDHLKRVGLKTESEDIMEKRVKKGALGYYDPTFNNIVLRNNYPSAEVFAHEMSHAIGKTKEKWQDRYLRDNIEFANFYANYMLKNADELTAYLRGARAKLQQDGYIEHPYEYITANQLKEAYDDIFSKEEQLFKEKVEITITDDLLKRYQSRLESFIVTKNWELENRIEAFKTLKNPTKEQIEQHNNEIKNIQNLIEELKNIKNDKIKLKDFVKDDLAKPKSYETYRFFKAMKPTEENFKHLEKVINSLADNSGSNTYDDFAKFGKELKPKRRLKKAQQEAEFKKEMYKKSVDGFDFFRSLKNNEKNWETLERALQDLASNNEQDDGTRMAQKGTETKKHLKRAQRGIPFEDVYFTGDNDPFEKRNPREVLNKLNLNSLHPGRETYTDANIEAQRQEALDWINSPGFLKVAGKSYSNPELEQRKRAAKVKNTPYELVDKIGNKRGFVNGLYDWDEQKILLENSGYKGIPLEEFNHSSVYDGEKIRLSTRELNGINRSIKDGVSDYYKDPAEVQNRVMLLRKVLKDNNVYDYNKDTFNTIHLKKLKEEINKHPEKFKYGQIKDLLKSVKTDADLIWLMNNLTSIEEDDGTRMAQEGMETKKYLQTAQRGGIMYDEEGMPMFDGNNSTAKKTVPPRKGVRKNPDGSHSTHLMAAETFDGKNWVVFPTLFQNPDGSWIDMSNEPREKAYKEAEMRGEVIDFGTDKDSALNFGKGSWKKEKPRSDNKGGISLEKEYTSTEGYKRNSPDRFNPYNIIPSGNITMEGVDFPILGIDNYGNEQVMTPGGNYTFPGDTVLEFPIAQRGAETGSYDYSKNLDFETMQQYIKDVGMPQAWPQFNNAEKALYRQVMRQFNFKGQPVDVYNPNGVNAEYYTDADGERLIQSAPIPSGSIEYEDGVATPIDTGVYIKEWNDSNESRPKNKGMAADWDKRRDEYVVSRILEDNPTLLERDVEAMNKLSMNAQKFLSADPRFQQSYWQDMKDGLYAYGASVHGMNNPLLQRIPQILDDPNKTNYEKQQLVSQYLNSPKLSALGEVATGAFAPYEFGTKLAQGLYKPDYSLDDALAGKRTQTEDYEQGLYDIGLGLATMGAGPLVRNLSKQGIKKVSKSTFKPSISVDDWKKWNPEIPKNKKLLNEYKEIEKAAKADGTWMKNADGSDFKGTPEQFVQINSENFKKAFGTQKGVDYDVMYRGINSSPGNIDNIVRENSDFKSFFASPNMNVADFYTSTRKPVMSNYNNKRNVLDELVFKKGNDDLRIYGNNQTWRNIPNIDITQEINKLKQEFDRGLRKAQMMHNSKRKQILEKEGKDIGDLNLSNKPELQLIKTEIDRLKNLDMSKYSSKKQLDEVFTKAEPRIYNRSKMSTDDLASYADKMDTGNIIIDAIDDGSFGTVGIIRHKPGRYAKTLRGNNGMFDMNNPSKYKALVPAAIGAGALQMFNDSYEEQSNKPPSERIGLPTYQQRGETPKYDFNELAERLNASYDPQYGWDYSVLTKDELKFYTDYYNKNIRKVDGESATGNTSRIDITQSEPETDLLYNTNQIQNLPLVTVTATRLKAAKHAADYEKKNPKPKRKQTLESTNWRKAMGLKDYDLIEWEKDRNRYVAQKVAEDTGITKRDVEAMNQITPLEEEYLLTQNKYQPGLWQDFTEGLETIGTGLSSLSNPYLAAQPFSQRRATQIMNSDNLTEREKKSKAAGYLSHPGISTFGDAMGVLSPLDVGVKALQAPFVDEYTMRDAFMGRQNDVNPIVGMLMSTVTGAASAKLAGKMARGISKSINASPSIKEVANFKPSLISQSDAVKARAERMLSQQNKWREQNNIELQNQFENAANNHVSDMTAQDFNIAYNKNASPANLGMQLDGKTFVYKDAPLTEANKARVAAHETGHFYRNAQDEADEWANLFDFSGLNHRTKTYLRGKGLTGRGKIKADEIRERAAQLKDYIAQKNNIPLNEDFIITQAQLDDAIKNYVKDTGLDNQMTPFLNSIKDKEGLLKMMNKSALTVPPAIIGTGIYLQSQQDDGYQKGGSIDIFRGSTYDQPIGTSKRMLKRRGGSINSSIEEFQKYQKKGEVKPPSYEQYRDMRFWWESLTVPQREMIHMKMMYPEERGILSEGDKLYKDRYNAEYSIPVADIKETSNPRIFAQNESIIENEGAKNQNYAILDKKTNTIAYYDSNNRLISTEPVITGTDNKDRDYSISMRDWYEDDANKGKTHDDYFKFLEETEGKITPSGHFTIAQHRTDVNKNPGSVQSKLWNVATDAMRGRPLGTRNRDIVASRTRDYGDGNMFTLKSDAGLYSSKAIHSTGNEKRINAFNANGSPETRDMSNGCINVNGKTICFDTLEKGSSVYILPEESNDLVKRGSKVPYAPRYYDSKQRINNSLKNRGLEFDEDLLNFLSAVHGKESKHGTDVRIPYEDMFPSIFHSDGEFQINRKSFKKYLPKNYTGTFDDQVEAVYNFYNAHKDKYTPSQMYSIYNSGRVKKHLKTLPLFNKIHENATNTYQRGGEVKSFKPKQPFIGTTYTLPYDIF